MKDGAVKTIFSRLWKWSWLVTLPVTVLLCLWAARTYQTYYSFYMKFNDNTGLGLRTIGALEAGFIADRLRERLLRPPKKGGLESIQLYVPEDQLKRLNSDLPYSGREYVPALLRYPDGEIHKVQLKYRGDYSYHWIGEKKSFRVKTKKSRLYEGGRQFNLVVPKTPYLLDNHLPYLVARRMGLLSPESKMVEVFINGRYLGVVNYVEQLGEQFLRKNGLMPGDLYVGEMVGKDFFSDVPRDVFLNAAFWTKEALNNHNPPEWNEALKELSSAIYGEDIDRLLEIIDLDAWARFAAFTTIVRTPHFDSMHNWRLYFDPALGRFIPVVWDPAGWNFRAYVQMIERQSNRMDIISSTVFELLHRDHRFLAAKHAAIESFFRSGGYEFILESLEDTGALESSLERDYNLFFEANYTLSPEEVRAELDRFRKGVKTVLEEVRRAYLEEPPSASYSYDKKTGAVQVNVTSFTPVERIEIDYASPVKGATVSYLQGGRLREAALSRPSGASAGNTLRIEAPLFARRVMGPPRSDVAVLLRDVLIEPASYIVKSGAGNGVLGVRAGQGGKVIELERKDRLPLYALDGNFSPAPLEKAREQTVWSGEVSVHGVREVAGDLTLRPGTTVRMGPGASIIVRGRLNAAGTAASPVSFVPGKAGQEPWGALVLSGSGADGSRLSHCRFTGGSGLRHRLVEYSAMLSIHGVKDARIEACEFSDSKVVDDMVHAVYSGIDIRDSFFSGAKSDALDLDHVKGSVVNTRFEGSGNDALDLMTSQVSIVGCSMERSGDKGVSVGEGSEAFISNTLLSGNQIGLQAKDSSTAVLYNVEMRGNAKTIDAYNKNWQYGTGGHAVVLKSVLSAGAPLATADRRSSVKVYDSFIEGGALEARKRVHVDATVDFGPVPVLKARTDKPVPDGVELPPFFAQRLGLCDPSLRGRFDHAD